MTSSFTPPARRACGNPACWFSTSAGAKYCCGGCATAAEHHYDPDGYHSTNCSQQRLPNPDSPIPSDWPCPECGYRVDAHGGWGGPGGCSLTDNGAAQRAYALRQGS